jgi:hypothetical protein
MRLSILCLSGLALLAMACSDTGDAGEATPDVPDPQDTADVLPDVPSDSATDGTSDSVEVDACVPWELIPIPEPDVLTGGDDVCIKGPGVATVDPVEVSQEDCELTESLQGKTLIVNALVLLEPYIPFLLDTLNPIWEMDIGNGTLIVLFHIESHDLDTGLITVQAGAGSYTDCENYSWYTTPTPVHLKTDGCNFSTVEPSQLAIFPATMSKAIIISNLELDGRFDPATGEMPGGNLVGTLRKSDTEGLIAIDLDVGVAELFEASGSGPDTDTDCDGEPDAWRLGGMIASAPVTNVSF